MSVLNLGLARRQAEGDREGAGEGAVAEQKRSGEARRDGELEQAQREHTGGMPVPPTRVAAGGQSDGTTRIYRSSHIPARISSPTAPSVRGFFFTAWLSRMQNGSSSDIRIIVYDRGAQGFSCWRWKM